MKLYLLDCDIDGDDYELLVLARNEIEAHAHWRKKFADTIDEGYKWVVMSPMIRATGAGYDEVLRIFEVRVGLTPGPLDWTFDGLRSDNPSGTVALVAHSFP